MLGNPKSVDKILVMNSFHYEFQDLDISFIISTILCYFVDTLAYSPFIII